MVALDQGEVDLGVEQRGVLELGIGALTAKAGEAGDAGGGQAAGDGGIGGQAGDGEGGAADGGGELAGLGAGDADAGVEDLIRAEEAGVAEDGLLVEHADAAVGLAVERQRQSRGVEGIFLAVADAQEPGGGGILLVVEADVTLVRVVVERDLDGIVVLRETGGGEAADRQTGDVAEGGDDLRGDWD